MPPTSAPIPTIGESGMLLRCSRGDFERAEIDHLVAVDVADAAESQRADSEDDQHDTDELHRFASAV